MDSDEDEVSCDIPLDDGGGVAGGGEGAAAAEEGSEGSLDWSVSAISGGMDPDRYSNNHQSYRSMTGAPPKFRINENMFIFNKRSIKNCVSYS